MEVLLDQNEYFKKFIDRYKYFVSDEQARLAYEARQKFLHDQASNITEALEDGRAAGLELGREEGIELGRSEGIELGRAEGEVEGKHTKALEAAQNMLSQGLGTIEQIALVTGLSEKEVKALSKQGEQGEA